jgi:short-subunit dehydrogenase
MKKVLITGCSSGLGVYLTKKFLSENFDVYEHKGKKHFDLSNENEVVDLAKSAKDFGVNILINNAAIVCPSILFKNYDHKLISSMIDVNLKAPILLSHFLYENLTDIININSIVGLEVKKLRTLYSATKWGLRGFSNSFKLEEQDKSILDVYCSNIKTDPSRENALNVDFVVNSIFDAFVNKESELILDGRNL